MATKKSQKKAAPGAGKKGRASDESADQIRRIGESASEIVREASLLLDEELAAGMLAARQMQQRFAKERRFDPTDFDEALERFQRDGHDILTQLSARLAELQSDDNAQRVKRLVDNGHSALDLTVEMAKMGTDLVNQLVQANLPRKNGADSK